MSLLVIPDEVIANKIRYIREQKAILDRDLVELYNVDTRVLKQPVRRNLDIFPNHFMFEKTDKEFKNWRSQFVTSRKDKLVMRYK